MTTEIEESEEEKSQILTPPWEMPQQYRPIYFNVLCKYVEIVAIKSNTKKFSTFKIRTNDSIKLQRVLISTAVFLLL